MTSTVDGDPPMLGRREGDSTASESEAAAAAPERRVGYSAGRAVEWGDVANRLRRELGWQPVYWVSQPGSHESVVAALPQTMIHSYIDLCRAIPPTGLPADRVRRPLSLRELAGLSAYEPIAMEMLDRIDIGRRFSYGERQRYFKRLMEMSLGIINYLNIELFVFNVPPHSSGEYSLYCSMKLLGREVRIFRRTTVNNINFVTDEIDDTPKHLVEAYEKRASSSNWQPTAAVMEEVEKLRAASSDFKPWYVSDVQERDERWQVVQKSLEPWVGTGRLSYDDLVVGGVVRPAKMSIMERLFGGRRLSNITARRRRDGDDASIRQVFKRPNVEIDGPLMTKWDFKTYRDWAMLAKMELKSKYECLASKPNLSDNFVFFAMHYQPERTTCPDGGRYNDQYLAIATLSAALPSGWTLLVKEHPSQFLYHGFGELSRWPSYYDDVVKLRNVRLVDLDVSGISLIDASRAVATITGAAGWQALVRGRPALCFGAAWYDRCRGAYRITSVDDARSALSEVAEKGGPALHDVLAYAATLEDVGRTCYTNTSLAKVVDISPEQQVDALASLLSGFESTRTPKPSLPQSAEQ